MEDCTLEKLTLDAGLKWHFFNLYCMALSDQDFDVQERQTLYSIGLEHGITAEQINELVVTANIKPVVPTTINDKVCYLYDLVRMAWADGKIEPEEKRAIRKCVISYGFKDKNADGIVDYLIESVKNNNSIDELITAIQ